MITICFKNSHHESYQEGASKFRNKRIALEGKKGTEKKKWQLITEAYHGVQIFR